MKIMQSQGFTLIELMVTIAIAAIIAMMAAPTFGDMIQNQNLNRSTSELVSQLNNARSQAALTRHNVYVVLKNMPESKDQTKTECANNKIKYGANCEKLLYWYPQGKSTLKGISPDGSVEINFLLTGGVSVATTFEICSENGKKSKIISVSRMGTIQRVTEGTCS